MRALIAVSLAAVLAFVAGCGDDSGSSADPADLEGIAWVLTSGQDITPPEGIAISALFQDGRVSGTAACNRYTGGYSLDGESLTIDPAASTRLACADAALSAAEDAYLAALPKVATWATDGADLVLSDSGGTEILRYAAASPVGEWTLVNLNTGSAITGPIQGTEITANFAADGTLSGSASCNTYSAGYTADRGALTVEPAAATQKACVEPEGIMEQEAAYLTGLAKATRYTLDGPNLTLLDDAGKILFVYVSGATA
jgi:heat shock protein HslJ